ncbi:hypothetical protein [Phenylobacterium sp.]|uniref:hypothetical protein n=1 Tax=Phenylobacterium sp. TaxID=1871053 RepID=UPI0027314B3E|nr:hypothetical protein [Phenylobacterium sp.]MDP1598715.1 hypothetical protein [Phenylobacterium sp.]
MAPATHVLTLPGPMLRRGFWLYVWRVETPTGELLYVGRTGDNSSPHANAPYTRMGQHLGKVTTQNALRKHLDKRSIALDACTFHLVSHGPLYDEVAKADGATREALMAAHVPLRDIVGAMEKALADDLVAAGYAVLNTVNCKWPLAPALWAPVRAAFAEHFPKISLKAVA